MKKLGEQPAYPTGKQQGYSPTFGLTYRQYLAAHIAGHMAANNDFTSALAEMVPRPDTALRAWGLSIWVLVDAVLEAEHET